MSSVSTYRRYVYQLTAGVDFLREGLGRLLSGTYAAITDALAEGARQAFVQGLPGHPEQLGESLDQVGSDRGLFRYRGESFASWSSRVGNAWQAYEQAGTAIQVLRAVNEWGYIVFPQLWSSSQLFLIEGTWARFSIFVTAGVLPWGPASTYGSGVAYGGTDILYGVSGAKVEDVNTLVRIVQKWKPKRSRGKGCIVATGHVYGEPLLTYGGGAVYGPSTAVFLDF